MAYRERSTHCIRPGCNIRPGKKGRGLCDRHHLECHKHVRDGKTTWEQLEQQGLCLPSATEATHLAVARRTNGR
jgi:hypothetical protein